MKNILFLLFLLIVPVTLFSHGNGDHGESQSEQKVEEASPSQNTVEMSTEEASPSQSLLETSTEEAASMTHGSSQASPHSEKTVTDNTKADELAIQQISLAYQNLVQPIFERKCYNCHSNQTDYPWYYSIPGIKQLMDKDIEEAKEHLDMSNGFPFGGHGTPLEDLESLGSTVEKDTMPPFLYKLGHRESQLTKGDKTKIADWIKNSTELLQK